MLSERKLGHSQEARSPTFKAAWRSKVLSWTFTANRYAPLGLNHLQNEVTGTCEGLPALPASMFTGLLFPSKDSAF